jgi:hypothetical protein
MSKPPSRAPVAANATPIDYPEIVLLDRANVRLRLRLGLETRSGRRWRVQAGDLDAYGQLTISSPPERRAADGSMTEADRVALAHLLGLAATVGPDGHLVEDSYDHYVEALDRAEGRAPRLIPDPLPEA